MKTVAKTLTVAALLLSMAAIAEGKKTKVGGDSPTERTPDDDWDKELDEEWEKWEKKSKKKRPKKEEKPMDPMEMMEMMQKAKQSGLDVVVLSWAMVALLGLSCGYMFYSQKAAWYGRYADAGGLVTTCIPASLAWFIQEVPALIIPLAMGLDESCRIHKHVPNFILWFLFILHYTNRSLIYPWRMIKSQKSSLDIVFMAFSFCVVNGYIQGRTMCRLIDRGDNWMSDPSFSLGVLMFFAGFVINLQCDGILRRLRSALPKKDDGLRYKTPTGSIFEYVSCANYFGEIVEWLGFAIACWSPASLAFAIATAANLIPRAWSHHRWYLRNIKDYPVVRRAIIPFLL